MSVDVDNTITVTGPASEVARWKANVITLPKGQVWDRIAILEDEPEKLVVDWTSNYSLPKSALQIDEFPGLDFEIASIVYGDGGGYWITTYFLTQVSGGKVTRYDYFPSYNEGGDTVLELRDFRGERERLLQKFGEGAFKKLNGALAAASKGKILDMEEDSSTLVHPEDDPEIQRDWDDEEW
jgi:hypothetical protein